jgi:RNA polymerase sigma factor (sigma-70 family)
MTPPIPLSDAAAIQASFGDPPAFGAIFDRHWVPIHRYCVVRAGAPGEDVAAETFRLAFDLRGRYDGRPDARPWLFGIATNLLRELFRRGARAERALRRSAAEVGIDPFEDALERVEAQQLGRELATALADLSPVERDALLLHACAELTYEEIARATAVPIGTVRSRIHRARTHVRAHLESLEVCR